MRERELSFKEAINEAIRAGVGERPDAPRSYTTPRDLGPATVDLTHALDVAAQLDDEAIARKLSEGR